MPQLPHFKCWGCLRKSFLSSPTGSFIVNDRGFVIGYPTANIKLICKYNWYKNTSRKLHFLSTKIMKNIVFRGVQK